MKRYVTFICIGLSIIAVIISFQFDVRWNGIVAWGLATIFLIFAAYFTKYIPEHEKEHEHQDEQRRSAM